MPTHDREGAMKNTITVRPGAAADAAHIARLFIQLGYPSDAGQVRARLDALANHDVVLIAQDGGRVCGVLVMHVLAPMHVPDPWAVISALVVDETSRSSGGGALLIAAAEADARRRGCAHLELSCSESRTRAHAFYAACGFVEKRKGFFKPLR